MVPSGMPQDPATGKKTDWGRTEPEDLFGPVGGWVRDVGGLAVWRLDGWQALV